jgi:FKBP-type peptidyl-prolyl cis-trans isomerase
VLTGLRIEELKIGDGAVASRGARITVRYSGYLNRGEPFQTDVVTPFSVGERNTIAGLAWGVAGMRVGGRRRLRVGPTWHTGIRACRADTAQREAGVRG